MNIAAEKAEVLKRFEKVNDPSLIKAIKNLLDFGLSRQKGEDEPAKLSPEQKKKLDHRLKKYDRGEMKFKSWDETRASIRKRAKNAL